MKRTLLICLSICSIAALSNAQTLSRYQLFNTGKVENSSFNRQSFEQSKEKKSVTLAVLYSLILPGAGEWYAGDFQTGKYFLMADGASWLTYAAFLSRGNWLRDDARSFATEHAGANFAEKDDQFLVKLGLYNSVDDYNQARLRAREFDQIYSSPNDNWRWDGDANRLRFKELRVSSDQMYQNAKFAVGALVLNRLISAFSAARVASRSNASYHNDGRWRLGAGVKTGWEGAHGIELRLAREF